MNNTPAWLTIAVAGTTALVALLASLITVKSANKRSEAELKAQQERFAEQLKHERERFASELEHQREQERKGLLFSERVKTYGQLASEFSILVSELPAINGKVVDSDLADKAMAVTKRVMNMYSLMNHCFYMSSPEVMLKASEFTTEALGLSQALNDALMECAEGSVLRAPDASLIFEKYGFFVSAVRRELGSSVDSRHAELFRHLKAIADRAKLES